MLRRERISNLTKFSYKSSRSDQQMNTARKGLTCSGTAVSNNPSNETQLLKLQGPPYGQPCDVALHLRKYVREVELMMPTCHLGDTKY